MPIHTHLETIPTHAHPWTIISNPCPPKTHGHGWVWAPNVRLWREVYFEGANRVWRTLKTSILNTASSSTVCLGRCGMIAVMIKYFPFLSPPSVPPSRGSHCSLKSPGSANHIPTGTMMLLYFGVQLVQLHLLHLLLVVYHLELPVGLKYFFSPDIDDVILDVVRCCHCFYVIVQTTNKWCFRNNERVEPTASCRWTGWVWGMSGWSSRHCEDYGLCLEEVGRIYCKWRTETWMMPTCHRLDLETLGSQPIVLKTFPGHCFRNLVVHMVKLTNERPIGGCCCTHLYCPSKLCRLKSTSYIEPST